MRSRLAKALVASALTTFALVTTLGAAAAIADDPPPTLANNIAPAIGGDWTVGGVATVSDGLWYTITATEGGPSYADVVPDSYSYQWYTVTSADAFSPIGGATSSTLTVPATAYTAGRISVEVTGHFAGFLDAAVFVAPVTVQQNPTAVYYVANPTVGGAIGGYVQVGSTLTVADGLWEPAGAGLGVSYQWVTAADCASIASGAAIVGEESSSLVVPASAEGSCVGVNVTVGSTGYVNSATILVAAGIAVVDPTGSVSGLAIDKHGDPVAGLTITILGDTTTDYAVTQADGSYSTSGLALGSYSVHLDATAAYYSNWPSTPVVITPAAPHGTLDLQPRAINAMHGVLTDADGLGIAGATLYLAGAGSNSETTTDSTGAFSKTMEFVSNDTYSLNFEAPDCTSGNVGPALPLANYPSAQGTGIQVTLDDFPSIDASNHGAILRSPGDLPQLSDRTPETGETLTTTTGSWTCAAGATYDYQWYRDGVAIDGAIQSSYAVVEADGGTELSSKVWAVTSFGKKHGIASEPTTEVELGAAPVPSVSPSITWSGTGSAPVFGDTLSVDLGTWPVAGTATYQWIQRAFNDGSITVLGTDPTLVPPPGAASSVAALGRDTVEVIVTYHAPGYEDAVSYLDAVKVDLAPAPVLLDPDSLVITGDLRVGEQIAFDLGDWDIPGAYASYSGWFMGPAAGITFSTLWTGAAFTIPATYPGFTANDPSAGAYVTVGVIVTAPGHESSASVWATAGPIAAAPISSLTPPQIDGEGTVGWTLTPIEGTYTSTPSTRSYSWYTGPSLSGPWTLLSAEDSFIPSLAQLGTYILLRESVAASGAGSTQAESAPLLIDTDDPTWVTSDPWVGYTGATVVGSTLTAVPGTWDRPLDTVEYSWILRLGDEANDHEVGTGPTYVPQSSDVGGYLFLAETGTIDGGIPHVYYAVTTMVTAVSAPPATTPPTTTPPTPPNTGSGTEVESADGEPGEDGTAGDEPEGDAVEDDAESADDSADGGDSAAGGDGESGSAATPAQGPNPVLVTTIIAGGVVLVGGGAFAGWWFFVRKPF